MKKALLTISIIGALQASAQYYIGPTGNGNPGVLNQEDSEYPVGAGMSSGWTTVLSGNKNSATWSPQQTLPFAFSFNGSAVSTFKVSSSGVLSFSPTGGAPSSLNYALPHSSIPNNSICVWGLSGKGGNDNIISKTFGTAPNRQFWVMFNDYSLPAQFNSHYTYWSIVFEEGSNAIYIVDKRTSNNLPMNLSVGIQIDGTTAISLPASPNVSSQSTGDATRIDNKYYSFFPGSQPAYDIKAEEVLMADILAANKGPYPVKLVVKNLGSNTISSIDLHYSNSGSLKTSTTINGLNILPWTEDTLSHTAQWAPQAGNTDLKVWTSQPNGNTDLVNANDTAIKSITILAQAQDKTPLIESFTSSTSPQSKSVNDQIQNTMAMQTLPAAHLKYPMSWPGNGDPYFTTEVSTRKQFYGVSVVPHARINGRDWDEFNNTINPNALAKARKELALVGVNATYFNDGQKVCSNVEISPLMNISNTDLKLFIAIYELSTSNNVKNSGETEFYNVVKKFMPNANGISLDSLNAGIAQSFYECFTFKGNYTLPANANSPVNFNNAHTVENFQNLAVVAWVQNENTGEVWQAAEASYFVGIDESQKAGFKVFPNPASDVLLVKWQMTPTPQTKIQLINSTGIAVAEWTPESSALKSVLPLPELANGVYFLVAQSMQNKHVEKVLILQ